MPASPRLIAGLSSSASAGPIGCTSGLDALELGALDFGVLPGFLGFSGFFAMGRIWARRRRDGSPLQANSGGSSFDHQQLAGDGLPPSCPVPKRPRGYSLFGIDGQPTGIELLFRAAFFSWVLAAKLLDKVKRQWCVNVIQSLGCNQTHRYLSRPRSGPDVNCVFSLFNIRKQRGNYGNRGCSAEFPQHLRGAHTNLGKFMTGSLDKIRLYGLVADMD